jgi:hypothetical protein
MGLFLWVLIALLALASIGKLIWLAKGDLPRRNPRQEACDVFINAALIAWAVYLLAKG